MRRVLSFSACLACTLALTTAANAQSWSASRARPSLHEIIAVDPSSESRWPFGAEDPAGDGLTTVEADEAAVDLRSVYADARGGRLWLRAYVSARQAPPASALSYYFIDADVRTQTGGKAADDKLWPRLGTDRSLGGYEHAVSMRGDGTLVAFYSWNTQKAQWEEQPANQSQQLNLESGLARDPLRLIEDDHGYTQVSLPLSEVDLDDRCLANIFVRTANDATGARAFGDDVDSFAMTCRPKLNRYGDPEILRGDVCTSDASCAGGGRCRDGICLIRYECSADVSCKTDQRCVNSVCVLVVEGSCAGAADCDGLVCDARQCLACSESGARACPSGTLCAPDGRCLRPGASSGSGTGGASASGIQVRGGAFSCSLAAVRGEPIAGSAVLLAACLAELWRRRRRARARETRGGES